MEIIKADKSHIDDIVKLNHEVQQLHVDLFPHLFKTTNDDVLVDHFTKWMDDHNFRFYLAKDNDKYIGYIICVIVRKPEHPFAHARSYIRIDQICVTKDMRGKGIGTALMDQAKDLAKSEKIDTLETAYWSANKTAGQVYRNYGFKTHSESMSLKVDLD